MKIDFSLNVSDKFLWGVMCTAIEGGFAQWADFTDFMTCQGEHGREYKQVTVHEYGDGVSVVSTTVVDLKKLAEGLRKVLVRDFNSSEDHASCNASYSADVLKAILDDDAGLIDSITADLIMQAACFGHIVYG